MRLFPRGNNSKAFSLLCDVFFCLFKSKPLQFLAETKPPFASKEALELSVLCDLSKTLISENNEKVREQFSSKCFWEVFYRGKSFSELYGDIFGFSDPVELVKNYSRPVEKTYGVLLFFNCFYFLRKDFILSKGTLFIT